MFVGSSRESLDYAYAIQENLDPHVAEVTVWPQGVFQIASFDLESLLTELDEHDFAVFVFAPDDLAMIRGRQQSVVRDNVIFELGLFMGKLGRERTFAVMPAGADLHLPSDLLGWNMGRYDSRRENLVSALGVACNQIRRAIRGLGRFQASLSRIENTEAMFVKSPAELPRLRNLAGRATSVIQPLRGPEHPSTAITSPVRKPAPARAAGKGGPGRSSGKAGRSAAKKAPRPGKKARGSRKR